MSRSRRLHRCWGDAFFTPALAGCGSGWERLCSREIPIVAHARYTDVISGLLNTITIHKIELVALLCGWSLYSSTSILAIRAGTRSLYLGKKRRYDRMPRTTFPISAQIWKGRTTIRCIELVAQGAEITISHCFLGLVVCA